MGKAANPAAGKGKKISLSANTAIPLFNALFQFDGYTKVVKGPGGEESIVPCLNKLGPVRLDIVMNANAIKKQLDAFDTVKQACVQRLTQGKGVAHLLETPALNAAYEEEIGPLAGRERAIELVPISRKALAADGNEFPLQALLTLEHHGLLVE